MAFTDPTTVPWTRASLLNELVDGINDRASVAGSTGHGWHPIATVTTATVIQRASFWSTMQQACEDLIADGNWAVAHSAGALIGATPAAAFDGTTPDTAIGTYANIGEVSTAMGVSFWRARSGSPAWGGSGQTAEHDVVNTHLITDLQSVLKALIWTKHSITWLVDGSEITGGGADAADATKDGAMTDAIAAYVTPGASTEPTSSYPHGIVGYEQPGAPGAYNGWASRSKNKGQIALVTGLECDIYWFGYPQRWTAGAPNEFSDQDSGAASLSENTWKHWETEGVTPGATPRTSSTHFGDYDFANSPTDKPDTTTTGARRGWTVQTGEDCAVIDWRDSITHYE